MVQIRKGGIGSNVHHSNATKKNYSSSNSSGSNSSNATSRNHTKSRYVACFKLFLLVVIAIQLLFLSYKMILVVVQVPPSSSSLSSSLSSTTQSTSKTSSTQKLQQHHNVRHVSRKDIIDSNNHNHNDADEVNKNTDHDNNHRQEQQPSQESDPDARNDVLKRLGTGPAREGFVVDLYGERLQQRSMTEPMRNKLVSVIQYIQNMIHPKQIPIIQSYIASKNTHHIDGNVKIRPCEYYQEPSSKTTTTSSSSVTMWMIPRIKSECTTLATTTTTTTEQAQSPPPPQLYGYNSAPFTRYYSKHPCGHSHQGEHHGSSVHSEDDNLLSMEPGVVISVPPYDPKLCPSTTSTPTINDICRTHVFPIDILHHDIQSIPPIVIYDATRTQEDLVSSIIPTQPITCDVPCHYDTNLHTNIMNRSPSQMNDIVELGVKGTAWKLKQTLADPYYNNNAKIERTNYRRDIYYSTTSFHSSVPLSFYNFDTYNIRNTKAIDFTSAKNAATYLLDTNCGYGNRHKWVAAVQVVLNVEAYGSCQNNVPLLPSETIQTMEGRIHLMRKNRIVLVLEAGTDRDRITDIVWEALLSGSVPAILGASNLEQHLPYHSAIFTSNYNSWDKFAAYVAEVSHNETLWNSYHEWRTDEKSLQKFEQRYAFVKSAPSPECRVCRWAYSKMYGLGFNHSTQVLQPTKLSRNLCTSPLEEGGEKANLITQPFRETWYVVNDHDETSNTMMDDSVCTPTTSSTDIIAVYGREMGTKYDVERYVVAHDGIIDITITKITNYDPLVNGPMRLRLDIDHVHNTDGASFRNIHSWVTESTRTPLMSSMAIQDEYAKVTIITNFITSFYSPAKGIIEIEITPGTTNEEVLESSLRIRIVLEDTHPIHDKLTEYFPSSYARQMMHDFIDPIELYYTESSSSSSSL